MTIQCENCDAYHSRQYGRVFGDNQNRLEACPDCETHQEMKIGVGAGVEPGRRI